MLQKWAKTQWAKAERNSLFNQARHEGRSIEQLKSDVKTYDFDDFSWKYILEMTLLSLNFDEKIYKRRPNWIVSKIASYYVWLRREHAKEIRRFNWRRMGQYKKRKICGDIPDKTVWEKVYDNREYWVAESFNEL